MSDDAYGRSDNPRANLSLVCPRAARTIGAMNTFFLLMAQYNGKAVIPIEDVCRDYFSHLTPTILVRKISSGELKLPLVRMELSQKAAKGVHLQDLASYIDERAEAARRECKQLTE